MGYLYSLLLLFCWRFFDHFYLLFLYFCFDLLRNWFRTCKFLNKWIKRVNIRCNLMLLHGRLALNNLLFIVILLIILFLFWNLNRPYDFNLLNFHIISLRIFLFPFKFLLLFSFLVWFTCGCALWFQDSYHWDILDGQRRIWPQLLPFVFDLLNDLDFWHSLFALVLVWLFGVIKVYRCFRSHLLLSTSIIHDNLSLLRMG